MWQYYITRECSSRSYTCQSLFIIPWRFCTYLPLLWVNTEPNPPLPPGETLVQKNAYVPLGRTQVERPLGRMGMTHGPGPHRHDLWANRADSKSLGKWP